MHVMPQGHEGYASRDRIVFTYLIKSEPVAKAIRQTTNEEIVVLPK